MNHYQIISIISYVFTTAVYFILCGFVFHDFILSIFVSINGFLSMLTILFWLLAINIKHELSNIEKDNGFLMKLSNSCINLSIIPKIKRNSRFCGTCRKYIPEMDHHCVFLNTCVSSKNYQVFFFLALACLTQLIVEVVVGSLIIMICSQRISEDLKWIYYFITAAYMLVCLVMLVNMIILAGFHIFLLSFKKMGTYDYMLERRRNIQNNVLSDIEEDISCSSKISEALRVELQAQHMRNYKWSKFNKNKKMTDIESNSAEIKSFDSIKNANSFKDVNFDEKIEEDKIINNTENQTKYPDNELIRNIIKMKPITQKYSEQEENSKKLTKKSSILSDSS